MKYIVKPKGMMNALVFVGIFMGIVSIIGVLGLMCYNRFLT